MTRKFTTIELLQTVAWLAIATGVVATSAQAQQCEVKIGILGPMSGGAAAWGLSAKTGVEFAVTMTNLDGGLQMGDRKCTVKAYTFDDQYTAVGGAAASNLLANENIHVAIGPVGSPAVTGFRPSAKRNSQISFNSAYMAGAIGPDNPLEFHAVQSPSTWGPKMVALAKDRFKFKSVMITSPNDQGGTDAGRQLSKIYSENDVKATEEYYQRGTTNFGPLATRILNVNPDTVEMSTMPPVEATNLTRQLIEAGYQGNIGVLGAAGAAAILQGAGGINKLKGFYWLEISPVDHPGAIKMKADYERIMKAPAPENALFPVYELAAEVALAGMSAAGTDQDAEKIAAALRKLTPESRYMGKAGWRGKTQYGVNQELTFPVGLGMIVDGKKLPVVTVEIPSE